MQSTSFAGIVVPCWMTLSKYLTGPWEPLRRPLHAYLIPVLGTLTILLLGLLISRWARRYEGIPA